MTVVDWLCSSFVHASPTSSSSKRADPRTRPLQMFAIFRRAGFHRCHADVCRRWSMGRPGGVRAFPSLAGNVCRHPPSPPVVGMFSFPAAPLTTVSCARRRCACCCPPPFGGRFVLRRQGPRTRWKH